MINELISYFNIQDGSVILTCDNQAAIRITSYDPNGVNPASCAHFDLVMAIQGIKSRRIKWIHTHVAGHQDSVKDHILSPVELLNVEMDAQAKAHWARTKNRETQRLHQFMGEPWRIFIASVKVTNDLRDQIVEWCQRPRIQEYWLRKERFQKEDLPHIDTMSAEAALQSVNADQRRWVVKHSSGFCGVNKWRKRWKQIDSEECPRCTHPVEDITHVWKCKGKDSDQKWAETLVALRAAMTKLRTAPLLIDIIISRLTTWQSDATPKLFPTLPNEYHQALSKQDKQGWQNFFIGLPSTGWHDLQQAHFSRLGLKSSGRRWLTAFIRLQWEAARDIWKYRNDIAHNTIDGEEAKALNEAIRAEYLLEQTSKDIKPFFTINLKLRLEASFDHKASWIHNVQIARARQDRRHQETSQLRTTMANWLASARQI